MPDLELYVSVSGDDNNPGTRTRPFATLTRARDALRVDRPDPVKASRPARVMVGAGTYYLKEPLWLGPQDGGSRECPVTWEAADGAAAGPAAKGAAPGGPAAAAGAFAAVVLHGGVQVAGWERYKGSILRAPLPARADWFGNRKPRQLFYKGQRQRRSRWPKFDPAHPVTGGWIFPEGPVAEREYEELVWPAGSFPRPWAKVREAEAHIYGGYGWTNTLIPILDLDRQRRTLRLEHCPINQDEQPWYFPHHQLTSMNRFFVENVLEEVTEPGDWCYDSQERALYFLPPDDSFDAMAVYVPIVDCLVRMRDTQFLTLRGFMFTCTTTGDAANRQGVQGLGAWVNQIGARYCGEALHLRGTRYCRVEGCMFDQVGGNAIYVERDNYRTAIRRNHIDRAGFNGVVLIGDRLLHPQFCEVTDNDIHHIGRIINYVAGVVLGISDSNWVAHNHIHDVPHYAVNLGSNGLGRNYVEWNEIWRTGTEISESGAISSWMDAPFPWVEPAAERSGHFIRWNLIGDPDSPVLEGEVGLWSTESRAMFLDDYTSNCVIFGNIILRAGTGIVFHGGKHNVAENNIFIGCKNQALEISDPVNDRRGHVAMVGWNVGNWFSRNIVVMDSPAARIIRIICTKEEKAKYIDSFIGQMDGNLFFHRGGGAYNYALVIGSARTWEEIQEIQPYEEMRRQGFDAGCLFADPRFVDAAKDDYRLEPDSPALRLGFVPIDVSRIGVRP